MSEIRLWHFSLDHPPAEADRLAALLAADELARASRYRDPKLGRRYIVGRASVRRVLGQCLDRSPKDIRFNYRAAGKPELADVDAHGLYFNLTHSQHVAILAVSAGRSIGVDVECVRPDFAGEEIAARFFSRREQEMLRALPVGERIPAFFRCWTRKEAFIKLLGAGLSFPLDEFDVSLGPDAPAEMLALRGDALAARRYSLHEIAAPLGHIAALAVEGAIDSVRVEHL